MKHNIVEDYRDSKNLMEKFFVFQKNVFPSYDFRIWYERGFWADNFIAYSIVHDEKIVSNVCISKLKIYLNGEIKNGLQFATVGTLPEYRKKRILL